MATDALDTLKAALADRYAIERELGRGGMAVVYLARDLKHDRHVALKVLTAEVAEGVKTERFMREIQLAGKLSHTNILPLYDSGDAGGSLFYVMPYVEGESLRDRLDREKRLSLEAAVQITREVAEALSYAHEQGVVHRDIKPENILLLRGHAVVMDFGIARALSAAQSQTVTQTGTMVGTPLYMSPEQAGGGAVDGRSDIYSLGCVLYEMLAGHPPFSGQSTQELLARHAMDAVPSLRAARAAVPEGLERAIHKALAKQPEDRFATAARFADTLTEPSAPGRRSTRRLVYTGLGLLTLVAGLALAGRRFMVHAPAAAPPEQSIAVLPFVNMSGDSANEYLSDGVSEELINALVQLPGLRVPARTSSFFFKGKDLSLRQIGDSLHVATVLEGSLRKAGNTLRITAQLIKVADGYHLWSETYDRELAAAGDVLTVQEEIAGAIVGALRVTLAPGESTALAPRHFKNVEAYDLYLRGRYFFSQRTRDAMSKAIDYFTRAIAQDSAYALAYSGLADAYLLGAEALTRRDALPKAETAALKAIQLDDGLAEPHVSLGRVREYHWDLQGAEREFRRAIQLNPKAAQAHSWYGLTLLTMRRCDEAIREATIAVGLEPLEPAYHNNLGNVLSCARRYDEAIAEYVNTIEMLPAWANVHRNLGLAYLAEGQFDAAIAEFQTLAKLNPRGLSRGLLGYSYTRVGRRAEALKLRRELEELRSKGAVGSYPLAVVSLGLGESDRALGFLEAAVETREFSSFFIRDAIWDPVRSDPRFVALLKKVGLEP